MKTIGQIKKELESLEGGELLKKAALYETDERAGVRKLLDGLQKREEKRQAEYARLEQLSVYEKEYAAYPYVCGIDEAGRGPLAGPVVAAAVVLPKGCRIPGVNDSKKLSEKKREELYDVIFREAVSVGVGMVGPERIDQINILNATYEAMKMAVSKLSCRPQVYLNDAVRIPGLSGIQVPIIKGDGKSISIASASIIAKVTRDRIMREYDLQYPEYGFAGHKGYGSQEHIANIKKYGPCPIHRRTFLTHFLEKGSL